MMGAIAPNLLNKTTTHYVATGLFFLFGLRSVYDQTVGYDANAESELEEVEKELKEHTSSSSSRTRGRGGRGGKTGPATRTRTKAKKQSPGSKINDILAVFFSPIFLQAFLMTFLAEWGDRSQIATIALAAAKEPFGITLGATIGHACCTGLAVIGGKLLASRISERMVRAPPPCNQYRQPTQMPRGCRPLARPPPSMTTMITTTTAPCAHRCLCRAARSSSSLPSARSSRARARSCKPSTARTAALCSTQSICLRALMCGTSHIYPV